MLGTAIVTKADIKAIVAKAYELRAIQKEMEKEEMEYSRIALCHERRWWQSVVGQPHFDVVAVVELLVLVLNEKENDVPG